MHQFEVDARRGSFIPGYAVVHCVGSNEVLVLLMQVLDLNASPELLCHNLLCEKVCERRESD